MTNINNITISKEGKNLILKNVKIDSDSYEYKLLNEEDIKNVLKPKKWDKELEYVMGDMITLDERAEKNDLNKDMLRRMLEKIDELLKNTDNYLISENSIYIDWRGIFVNEDMTKIKIIIIPNMQSDFSYELSKLLIRVLRHIDTKDKESLNYAYNLFITSSKTGYTISDLMEV